MIDLFTFCGRVSSTTILLNCLLYKAVQLSRSISKPTTRSLPSLALPLIPSSTRLFAQVWTKATLSSQKVCFIFVLFREPARLSFGSNGQYSLLYVLLSWFCRCLLVKLCFCSYRSCSNTGGMFIFTSPPHRAFVSDIHIGSSGTIKLAKKTASEKPATDKKPAAPKVCTKV